MKIVLLVLALVWPLESLDVAFQGAVQSMRTPQGDKAMNAVSRSGRPVVVFGGLLAIAIFGGPAGVVVARHAIYALLPTNLVVEGLKRAVFRTRPDGERKRSNASFPSSHTANAFAVAAVLSRRWRRAAPALWVLATLVAFSRIYLNRHYLSDVVVGAAIGILAAYLIDRLAKRQARQGGSEAA